MSLFFKSTVTAPGSGKVPLQSAPGGGPIISKEFRWVRVVLAVVFLIAIFIAGIYCARDPQLTSFRDVLVHSFEILLGALVGTIIGESSAG
jgi:SNF family Na+-dependent transporter